MDKEFICLLDGSANIIWVRRANIVAFGPRDKEAWIQLDGSDWRIEIKETPGEIAAAMGLPHEDEDEI